MKGEIPSPSLIFALKKGFRSDGVDTADRRRGRERDRDRDRDRGDLRIRVVSLLGSACSAIQIQIVKL